MRERRPFCITQFAVCITASSIGCVALLVVLGLNEHLFGNLRWCWDWKLISVLFFIIILWALHFKCGPFYSNFAILPLCIFLMLGEQFCFSNDGIWGSTHYRLLVHDVMHCMVYIGLLRCKWSMMTPYYFTTSVSRRNNFTAFQKSIAV